MRLQSEPWAEQGRRGARAPRAGDVPLSGVVSLLGAGATSLVVEESVGVSRMAINKLVRLCMTFFNGKAGITTVND